MSGLIKGDEAVNFTQRTPVAKMLARGSLAVIASAACMSGANAQTESPAVGGNAPERVASASGLEDIIVTARRKGENLQSVPIAVTALSGEALAAKSINQVSELSSVVPSLRFTTYNTPDTLIIGIRGQRNAFAQLGQDPSVGFYVADVPNTFQQGINQALFDLADIQVLKGPQGTLFGRNSTGGAVLVTPHRPTDRLEGYVRGGVTIFDGGAGATGLQFEGVLNVPVSENLSVRAGIRVQDQGGFVKNVADPNLASFFQVQPTVAGPTDFKPLGSENYQAWRVSALWTPLDTIESYFLYEGTRYRSNGWAPTMTALNPTGTVANRFNGVTLPSAAAAFQRMQQAQAEDFWSTQIAIKAFNRVDIHSLSNTTSFDFGGVQLKNIIGYRHVNSVHQDAYDSVPFQVLSTIQYAKGYQISDELQLSGKAFNDTLDWVAGVFFFRQKSSVATIPTLILSLSASGKHGSGISESYSIYAQGTQQLRFLEGLSLTAGVRYNIDFRQMNIDAIALTPSYVPSACGLFDATGARLPLNQCFYDSEKTFKSPTYNISLDYKFDNSGVIYLAHRRGYRSGGFNFSAVRPSEFLPFNQEVVKDYEIGFKKDWRIGGATIRTNIAAYHQDYTDIQRNIINPQNLSTATVLNAAGANIDGGELEVTINPFEGLEIGGNIGLVYAKYTEFMNGTVDISDHKFAQTPKKTFGINGRYTHDFGEGFGELSIGADYSHQSFAYFDDNSQGAGVGPRSSQGTDPYGTLNLRTDWKRVLGSGIDMSFWVKNVTNTKAYVAGIPVYQSLGFWTAYLNHPRVFGIEMKYSFGQ